MPCALDLVIVPKRQLVPDQLSLDVATRELLPILRELSSMNGLWHSIGENQKDKSAIDRFRKKPLAPSSSLQDSLPETSGDPA